MGANRGPTDVRTFRNHCSKSLFEPAPGQACQRTGPTNYSSRAATVERSIIVIVIIIIVIIITIIIIIKNDNNNNKKKTKKKKQIYYLQFPWR